jgi:hypothetical protein
VGVFRRHEPSAIERALGDRFRVRTEPERSDRFELRAGPDGIVRDACWFCGRELELDLHNPSGDTAAVMIEPFGAGEPMHGVCHRDCAERAKGALSF